MAIKQTFKKVGKQISEFEAPKINNWIVKTLDNDSASIVDKAFPYRFTKGATAGIVAGSVAHSVVSVGTNENQARKFRKIEATRLANTVGHTPLTVDPEIVRELPSKLRTSAYNKAVDYIPGVEGRTYDDMGAGGDLVLAMHRLR